MDLVAKWSMKTRLEKCLNKAVEKLGRENIKLIKDEAVKLYNSERKNQPLNFLIKQEVFKNYF